MGILKILFGFILGIFVAVSVLNDNLKDPASPSVPKVVESAAKSDIFEENADRVSQALKESTKIFAEAVEKADQENGGNMKWQAVKKNLKTTFVVLGKTAVSLKNIVVATGSKIFTDNSPIVKPQELPIKKPNKSQKRNRRAPIGSKTQIVLLFIKNIS